MFVENLGPGHMEVCTVWRLRTLCDREISNQQATCVDMVCICVTFEFTHHECPMSFSTVLRRGV